MEKKLKSMVIISIAIFIGIVISILVMALNISSSNASYAEDMDNTQELVVNDVMYDDTVDVAESNDTMMEESSVDCTEVSEEVMESEDDVLEADDDINSDAESDTTEVESEVTLSSANNIYTRDASTFKSDGVWYDDNYRYTYYSSKVLHHYRTDEWTPDEYGLYRDSEGYAVVASSDLAQGTVIYDTPFGNCKVYDSGCASGTLDVYVNF